MRQKITMDLTKNVYIFSYSGKLRTVQNAPFIIYNILLCVLSLYVLVITVNMFQDDVIGYEFDHLLNILNIDKHIDKYKYMNKLNKSQKERHFPTK